MSQRASSLLWAALALPGILLTPISRPVEAGASPVPAVQSKAQFYVPSGASRLSGSLGRAGNDQRRYRISCFDNGSGIPNALRIKIRGVTKNTPFALSLTIERQGVVQTVVDKIPGDGVFSAYAALTQGPGEYTMTIQKQKKKATAPDASLTGVVVFETRQECDAVDGRYAGIVQPVLLP